MKHLRVFMFVDALGWRIVQRHGFLQDLLPHQQPCNTVFGYSSTCDPTILTGCMPEEHGHFSCFVAAPETSPFTTLARWSWLPQKLAGHHRIRSRLSRWIARRQGYTGYFQLYSVPFACLPFLDYTEKKDIYEPGGILGGQPTVFEHWQRSGKPWMRSDWRRNDATNLTEVETAVSEGNVENVYLFTGHLDAVMHRHGPEGPAVEQALDHYATRIRTIFDKARGYADVRFYVFSDHGMARTTHGSDLLPRFLRQLPLRYGHDYIAAWDSTMVRFWFPGGPEIASRVQAWLEAQPDGTLVTKQQLKDWRCWWPDARYGELFYLLPSGSIFTPSHMNQGWVTGMHGYDPAHEDSTACWLTNDPEARANRLDQIFPIMIQ